MLKNALRIGSVLSAVTIGAVLVGRAAGCTNGKPLPQATVAQEQPAVVDAGQPVDGGFAQGIALPADAFLPATKAAAPIFHADPPPAQEQAPK
jgi:hypothetical protein